MENEDNFDLLFEQKMNDGLFNMEDENLTKLKLKAKESQKKLNELISTIFNESELEIFKELLEERDNNYSECFYLENRLYYKHGISDGFSMVLTSLKSNVNFSN